MEDEERGGVKSKQGAGSKKTRETSNTRTGRREDEEMEKINRKGSAWGKVKKRNNAGDPLQK